MHDQFVISLQRFVGISSGGLGRLGRRSGLELVMLCLVCAPATATPLISELFYDAVGSDNGQSFVEIYGQPGSDLTGLTLEGVNGSNGAVGPVIELAGTIPADGIFVVADMDGDGLSLVAEADQLANFDFQNGPDSVVLYDGDAVLDAVGYGDFDPEEIFAGEGMPAPDPPAGSSLARVFADVDSDDNSLDFEALDVPTPGSAELQSVPEPGSALLGSAGLLGLAFLGRRGRGRRG
ncbi:MAG: hypothetical protein JRG96_01860 [Deltaproteobacteria bacterium]|nr:hypothetical protein [Deltaproteobacteria bacterium]MBW2417833.1 hypothetical protein [Deltaproteobacteria bacterium]